MAGDGRGLQRIITLMGMAFAACGDEATAPRSAPTIERFDATPSEVPVGRETTLRWLVTGAERVTIGPRGRPLIIDGPSTGDISTGALTETTTFDLQATGPGGRSEASVVVTVGLGTPVIERFTASETTVAPEAAVRLAWSARDAQRVRLQGRPGGTIVSDGPPIGEVTVTPIETSTYTLSAVGPLGTSTATLTVNVVIPSPDVIELSIDRSPIFVGERIGVAWSTRFTDRVELADGDGTLLAEGNATDNAIVTLFETTQLVLTAFGPAGTTTASVGVVVLPVVDAEIFAFAAAPNPVRLGEPTTLRWSVRGASELTVDLDGQVVFADARPGTRGQTQLIITDLVNAFRLTAQGPAGTVTATVTVYGHAAPIITKFEVDPIVRRRPGPVRLDWITANVARLSLTANGRTVPGFTGVSTSSLTVDVVGATEARIDGPTIFTLTAASAADTVTEQRVAIVGSDEFEPNDSATTAQTLTGTIGAVLADLTVGNADWFRLSVPAGGQLRAETNFGPGQCAVDTRLQLIGPDGMALAEDDDDGPLTCAALSPVRDLELINLAAGTYFLVVTAPQSGPYVLTYEVNAPVCGDAQREGNETCDDGNRTALDGCSAGCQIEVTGAPLSPPGGVRANVVPMPPGFAAVAVDVLRAGQSITATAADAGGATCNAVDTALTLIDSTGAIRGRKLDGGPPGTAGACAVIDPTFDGFARDLPVGRFFLLTRSEGTTGGSVEVDVAIDNPSCGNRRVEQRAGEQCDDGNRRSGDGCSATCMLEVRTITEAEPNDTQATATPTGLSGPGAITISGANTPSGDDDVFRVDLAPGQTVNLDARTYSTPGQPLSCNSITTDTRLFVERAGAPATRPGTTELAYNDDIDNANNIWCSGIQNLRLSGGMTGASYFVRVQGWNDQQATVYQLDLTLTP